MLRCSPISKLNPNQTPYFHSQGLELYVQSSRHGDRELHAHDQTQIILPLSGLIQLGSDELKRVHGVDLPSTFGPGTGVHMPAGTPHAFNLEKAASSSYVVIYWHSDAAREFQNDTLVFTCHPATVRLATLLTTDLPKALEESCATTFSQLLTWHLRTCKKTLSGLLQPTQESLPHMELPQFNDERLQRGLERLKHTAPETWNVPNFAKLCGMSTRTLTRQVQSEIQQSPRAVIENLRMSQAIRLLLQSKSSITTIALECGYQSISQFNRVFQKRYLMSPRAVRASALQAVP